MLVRWELHIDAADPADAARQALAALRAADPRDPDAPLDFEVWEQDDPVLNSPWHPISLHEA